MEIVVSGLGIGHFGTYLYDHPCSLLFLVHLEWFFAQSHDEAIEGRPRRCWIECNRYLDSSCRVSCRWFQNRISFCKCVAWRAGGERSDGVSTLGFAYSLRGKIGR